MSQLAPLAKLLFINSFPYVTFFDMTIYTTYVHNNYIALPITLYQLELVNSDKPCSIM